MYELLTRITSEPGFHHEAPRFPTLGPPAASASALAQMLDIVDYGLLLVFEDSQVVFANQVARAELDDSHPLQLHGKQLRLRRTEDVVPLRSAISGACKKGLQKLVTLGRGKESITLSVVPVNDTDANFETCAMLLFGKRKACENLSLEAFARHHKLTAAELRVLKALCEGRRPSDIARDQGVALCTVRTQIGCAREKTRAASIGELIRQVANLPPMQRLIRTSA